MSMSLEEARWIIQRDLADLPVAPWELRDANAVIKKHESRRFQMNRDYQGLEAGKCYKYVFDNPGNVMNVCLHNPTPLLGDNNITYVPNSMGKEVHI